MGAIRIDKVDFTPSLTTTKTATVKHRKTSDADTSANYTVDTTSLVIPVDGILTSPFYIYGLNNNTSYTVRINTDCSSLTKVFIVGDPVITTTTTSGPLTTYWGWKADNSVLTESAITSSSNNQIVTPTQNITCTFAGGVGTPSYLWMAEPLVCTAKTKWQDTVQSINNGNIGTGDDLFDTPVTSGGFRFYISVYRTEQANPISFKVI